MYFAKAHLGKTRQKLTGTGILFVVYLEQVEQDKEIQMLPRKLRTAKIQKKILQPEGIELWQAPVITKWLDGHDTVTIDDLDVAIINATCQYLRAGAPGIGWRPLRKANCGNEAIVSAERLSYLLGASR